VADALISQVFVFTALPLCVHSDNEPVLVAEAMRYAFQLLGVRRSTITVRHPQGNAPVERFMRYLNGSFSITLPDYRAWPQILPLILFAYRTLPHETTGFSPFFLMFGREPILPLDCTFQEDGPISLDADSFSSAQGYAHNMVNMLATIFTTVRRRQEMKSRENAARRDEDQNRVQVTFQQGDPVLFFEPDATSAQICEVRTELLPIETCTVPDKWKLPWSGPHPIVKALNDNVYLLHHMGRDVDLSANVDSLVLYHPFSEIPCVPQRTLRRKRRSRAEREKKVPPVHIISGADIKFKDAKNIEALQKGDLCIVSLPSDLFEPMAVMKFIDYLEEGRVEMQWFGRYYLSWYIDVRMRQMEWEPAWWQANQRKFYFAKKPTHSNHKPFTNVHSEAQILKTDIIAFQFKLNDDSRLPGRVADYALRTWRRLGNPPDGAWGERTYELNPGE